MAEEVTVVEEKPEVPGGVSEEVGVSEREKRTPALVDEEGRKYIIGNFGNRRYLCEIAGCGKLVKSGELRCKKHRLVGTGTLESQNVIPEVRMVQKFIRNFLRSAPQRDPKIHAKLNDLEKSVSILNDKMTTMLTAEQLRQAGFYFGSILFQYITDGNRYEAAKKEYLDCLKKIGCFTNADLESIEKSGTECAQPKAVS